MPGLETAGEVVMAVEVQAVADPNEPGSAAGATGHTAGDGDHGATPMLPGGAFRTLAGLPGLSIERIAGRIAMGVERLIGRLIIGPADTTNQVSQDTLAIRGNDGHAKVMM